MKMLKCHWYAISVLLLEGALLLAIYLVFSNFDWSLWGRMYPRIQPILWFLLFYPLLGADYIIRRHIAQTGPPLARPQPLWPPVAVGLVFATSITFPFCEWLAMLNITFGICCMLLFPRWDCPAMNIHRRKMTTPNKNKINYISLLLYLSKLIAIMSVVSSFLIFYIAQKAETIVVNDFTSLYVTVSLLLISGVAIGVLSYRKPSKINKSSVYKILILLDLTAVLLLLYLANYRIDISHLR